MILPEVGHGIGPFIYNALLARRERYEYVLFGKGLRVTWASTLSPHLGSSSLTALFSGMKVVPTFRYVACRFARSQHRIPKLNGFSSCLYRVRDRFRVDIARLTVGFGLTLQSFG